MGPGSDADVTATYRNEPFGQNLDTTGEFIQPYRFAGQYLDSQTGHYVEDPCGCLTCHCSVLLSATR